MKVGPLFLQQQSFSSACETFPPSEKIPAGYHKLQFQVTIPYSAPSACPTIPVCDGAVAYILDTRSLLPLIRKNY